MSKVPMLEDVVLKQFQQLNVSRETIESQRQLVGELLRWQKKTNLIAPSTIEGIWSRHVLDSLQIIQFLKADDIVIDLGAGGGFPCLPLALAKNELPQLIINAVESNHKKTSFLRHAVRTCGAQERMKVHSGRIEESLNDVVSDLGEEQSVVITARALADLAQLFSWIEPITGGKRPLKFLFHKGREYRSEIDACSANWCFDVLEHKSVVDPESRILEISNLSKIV